MASMGELRCSYRLSGNPAASLRRTEVTGQRESIWDTNSGSTTLPNISPNCVVKVDHGRGFIVRYRVSNPHYNGPASSRLRAMRYIEKRVVLTAAHCLLKLPPANPGRSRWELAYKNLLGRLNDAKCTIWAECVFVDPVADVAVLGSPDDQELGDQADAYHSLVDDSPALRIADAQNGPGWMLSLDGHWIRTRLEVVRRIGLASSLCIGPTKAGMSGSPILDDSGRAVSLVSLGTETVDAKGRCKEESAMGQPILLQNLPGWLLPKRSIGAHRTL